MRILPPGEKELSTALLRVPLKLIHASDGCQFLGWACCWPSLGVAKAAVSRYNQEIQMQGQKEVEKQEGPVDLTCLYEVA